MEVLITIAAIIVAYVVYSAVTSDKDAGLKSTEDIRADADNSLAKATAEFTNRFNILFDLHQEMGGQGDIEAYLYENRKLLSTLIKSDPDDLSSKLDEERIGNAMHVIDNCQKFGLRNNNFPSLVFAWYTIKMAGRFFEVGNRFNNPNLPFEDHTIIACANFLEIHATTVKKLIANELIMEEYMRSLRMIPTLIAVNRMGI